MANLEDHLSAIRYMLAEALRLACPGEASDTVVSKIRACMATDSKNCCDNLLKNCAFLGMKETMVGIDLQAYQQRCVMRQTPTRMVCGDTRLANTVTKTGEPQGFSYLSRRTHDIGWRMILPSRAQGKGRQGHPRAG